MVSCGQRYGVSSVSQCPSFNLKTRPPRLRRNWGNVVATHRPPSELGASAASSESSGGGLLVAPGSPYRTRAAPAMAHRIPCLSATNCETSLLGKPLVELKKS